MSCDEVQMQLSALLDDELIPEAAAIIEAHLAGCARCSEARDEMSAVLKMTKAWDVQGSDVLAAVQQKVQQDEIHSALMEIKLRRAEVDSLRAEVAELKSQRGKRDVISGRKSSLLRFPYATARDVTHPIL